MTPSQQQKGRDSVTSTLDLSIHALNHSKDTCGIPPAQAAFGSTSLLLTMIRDTMVNDQDYVGLGRTCGDVCQVLYRKLQGKQSDQLTQSVLDAIEELTTTLANIQGKVVKRGKQNVVHRLILSKGDKNMIASWKQDLVRILHVFNTELATDANTAVTDTQTMVTDMQQNKLAKQDSAFGQNYSTRASVSRGELPPPPPRDCFGREGVIEEVIGLAENLEPVALVGAGGIGKTSIALTVLHHKRIRKRFGENRRFIRCDQFPASRANFLARLSKVIGSGVENPEDLTTLRPFLTSQEMLIILDNAESVLDPQGTGAREIYPVVEELCHQFRNICLLITSRIATVPPRCKHPEIPTLSIEAACDIFHSTYGNHGKSGIINDLLQRLSFHALSIKLLATTASRNSWDHHRLAKEWDAQRALVLRNSNNESLAATIELSLSSPTFRNLDQNARDLLGVIAFFPQGIDEKNIDWLFPTISNGKHLFDVFCLLSLTYQSNGFVTMLAPIRDYLIPQDPQSSPLLRTTKDRYFARLSIRVHPDNPKFGEARWVVSEDVNIEHLFDVFTSVNPNAGDIWGFCHSFMEHLYWHKPRSTILGSKIEALRDGHPSKPKCMFELSRLLAKIGHYAEQKRLLTRTLELDRRRGNDVWTAATLRNLSDVNRLLQLFGEGIRQAKEALEISERAGDKTEQASCLYDLAHLLFDDRQLDAAENAASRAIDLISGTGRDYIVCNLRWVLGRIHRSKGEKEKAIYNFETALKIATPPNWHTVLFWLRYSLAELSSDERKFDDANTHIERAKSHALEGRLPHELGEARRMQAVVWCRQLRLEDAKSEASQALEIFENLGAVGGVKNCQVLLQHVEQTMKGRYIRLPV